MRKRTRRRLKIAAWVVGGLVALHVACTIPPKALKEVKGPRDGRALGQVALVMSERYEIKIPGVRWVHPFDTRKHAKIFLRLRAEGLTRAGDTFVPDEATREDLLRVHTEAYLATLEDSANVARYLEAPIVAGLPSGLVDRAILRPHRYATGGTIEAGRLALAHGIGINLGGGFHHAGAAAGEGFCIYNDQAVAIGVLRAEGLVRRALVVDLDVHQGNGTATIFAGDDEVYTFSMHEGDIYPVPKATSDRDVELAPGTDDAAYLALLAEHLPEVLAAAEPDIVFLQAGADTLKGDRLARLAMTTDGLVERDAMVIDACRRRGLPVVVTLGGGYIRDLSWKAQCASVRRTIETYGVAPADRGRRREHTVKEKLYMK